MYKTFDFPRHFDTFDPNARGVCRIRVFEECGTGSEGNPPPNRRPPVIVVSQVSGSVASVTNFAEQIASGVLRTHGSRLGLLPVPGDELPSGPGAVPLVWVEHYPLDCQSLITQDDCRTIVTEEVFQVVTFAHGPGGELAASSWQPVCRCQVERFLLRAPLGD